MLQRRSKAASSSYFTAIQFERTLHPNDSKTLSFCFLMKKVEDNHDKITVKSK